MVYIPQGSILGPVILNLRAADIKNILDGSECIRYIRVRVIVQRPLCNNLSSEARPRTLRCSFFSLFCFLRSILCFYVTNSYTTKKIVLYHDYT